MMVTTFKFLTKISAFIAFFAVSILHAQIFAPENGKTHLRWNLFASKEQLVISKRGDKLTVKTLNAQLFESLKNEINQVAKDKRYVTDVRFIAPSETNNVSTIEVTLTNPDVEVFS